MYRLHCFAQSGNSYKVALLLRVLGQPFEAVFVDYMQAGATRDPDWRENLNEMGEAPVLEDGTLRLTQSGVILDHLAQRHGRFGGDSALQKQEILRWLLFDNHKFTSYFASYRFARSFGASAPEPAVMGWLAGRIEAAYAVVDKHLSTRDYLVGNGPTIADFSLAGYVFYPEEENGLGLLQRHRQVGAWAERLSRLEGWAPPYEVMPGDRILPRW
ncbi:glutathione S-transferase family protein [Variovorax sp. OV329]|uniref:glutathione S-transferase family protein n=1 Tax=Variovorax sp. OV329 TaxID=1882825 RepID=UPI0008EE7C29|nr:glutathione S-transferase [Variovorax sp. OV329]SFM77838.1 glutathione S-transferase [Variovorax sp. OV329]